MPRLVDKNHAENLDRGPSDGADQEDIIRQLTALRAEVRELVGELLAINARHPDSQDVRT